MPKYKKRSAARSRKFSNRGRSAPRGRMRRSGRSGGSGNRHPLRIELHVLPQLEGQANRLVVGQTATPAGQVVTRTKKTF